MDIYLWNDSNLQSPPIYTYKSEDDDIDIKKISAVVDDAVTILKHQQTFHSEAAILSRLIYKLGTKFRHDVGFSFLKRTNTAVKKYLHLNILSYLTTFLDVVSDALKGYYPTRQMLEFILIRFQTFSKLMNRIERCSKKSATFYLDRIRRGDAWWLSFMPYSVLCRIWYISRHLLTNCYKWYKALFPFRNSLKIVGKPFIPNGYEFPLNLEQWIQDGNEDGEKSNEPEVNLPIIPFENNENRVNEINENISNSDIQLTLEENRPYGLMYNNMVSDDIGEIVSRDSLINTTNKNSVNTDKNSSKNFKTSKRVKKENVKNNVSFNSDNFDNNLNNNFKNNSHSINMVKNLNSFKQFVNVEERCRNANDNKALTTHLGFMQWHSLKTIINELICKINKKNESKILKKIQNIWKNKCTTLKN